MKEPDEEGLAGISLFHFHQRKEQEVGISGRTLRLLREVLELVLF